MDKRTRLVALLLILALAAVAGVVRHYAQPGPVTRLEHQNQMQQREVRQRFEQAAVMLHARQYDHAIAALQRVLELSPRLPEAHVNMGYALIGLQRYDEARGFFETATELNPQQGNAYYGMALVHEAKGDYESALGNMRTYLHFSHIEDPHRMRARAAIWEWEAKLGRHPGAPGAAQHAGPSGGRTPAPTQAGRPELAAAPAAGAASAPQRQ